jgi:hypothetical protein
MQTPLADDLDDFEFQNPNAELGGIAGTQNFGYLVAAYEAGKRGVPLNETTFTINEDDQRYLTLATNSVRDNLAADAPNTITEIPDLLAERAAWFKDPETLATTGRYTGHTGNPISLVRDTLELGGKIMHETNKGESSTYDIFDPETGDFRKVSTEEAYQLLPKILRAAAQRQLIAALWTKERHYRENMDWEEASKLDLGNITLTGESVKKH